MEAKLRARHPDFDPTFRDQLQALLAWRRDVRRFRRDALPQGTIERLIEIACLSPSVGLSEPWRFVIVEDQARRAAIRDCFGACNQDALRQQEPDRASLYARLKLSGLDDAPSEVAVFADHATAQGHGLGRLTMPATLDYSVAIATRYGLQRGRKASGWAGCRSSIRRELPRSWTCRKAGPLSDISALAIRRKRPICRPCSARAGSGAILRRAW